MAALTGDDLARFYLGLKTLVESSNLAWAEYDVAQLRLTIGYRDGSIYAYPGVSPEEAEDFALADSKGEWRHQNLPTSRPYEALVKAAAKGRKGARRGRR